MVIGIGPEWRTAEPGRSGSRHLGSVQASSGLVEEWFAHAARPPTPWGGRGPREVREAGLAEGLDREAERPHHVAAVVGDLVRAPRRHPHPVDAELLDDAVQ